MVISVPRLFPGSVFACVATGPSLTQEDVDYLHGRCHVIAINDAYKLAPWADCLYGTDARWWHWHHGVPSFTGPKWSLEHSQWGNFRARYPDVQRLVNTGPDGLEHKPTGLKNGRNSGYAAVNLAVHYGAKRIILMGYDLQNHGGKSHFFGEHPNRSVSPYSSFRQRFQSLVKPLKKVGIEVINCSAHTALTAFPCAPLRETLKADAAVAA